MSGTSRPQGLPRGEIRPDRPNILWICSDQQRWDTLGCYGNPFVATPNLDRLAREGMCFERAYAQSPVCTPSGTTRWSSSTPTTARCPATTAST
ncbi:MAG: sulfatase-like hydrolase/transferase [Planctomycetota bacterium]